MEHARWVARRIVAGDTCMSCGAESNQCECGSNNMAGQNDVLDDDIKTNRSRRQSSTTRKTRSRLTYLARMIEKYAHRWGASPSARLHSWVTEYNDIRHELVHPDSGRYQEWVEYCHSSFPAFDIDHDGYDILA